MNDTAEVTIIGSYVSPYVRKVLACLMLKGIEFEVDPITPFYGNEEFTRLSPLRRIPVLICGDLALSDSSVICAWIEEAYPDAHPLLPATPADRARARWLEEYADTRMGDVFIWDLFYQKVVHPIVWREPGDAERIEDALNVGIPSVLDYLEGELPQDGYIFGEVGLADVSIATFFRNAQYAGYEVDAERWPRAAGFVTRMLSHPVFARLAQFEQAQFGVKQAERRAALEAVGARLTDKTWGLKEPQTGTMRL